MRWRPLPNAEGRIIATHDHPRVQPRGCASRLTASCSFLCASEQIVNESVDCGTCIRQPLGKDSTQERTKWTNPCVEYSANQGCCEELLACMIFAVQQ